MTLALAAVLGLLAAFLFIWADNLMFVSHLHEDEDERKKLRKFQQYAFVLYVGAIALIITASLLAGV